MKVEKLEDYKNTGRMFVNVDELLRMVYVNCVDKYFKQVFWHDPADGIEYLIDNDAIPVYISMKENKVKKTTIKELKTLISMKESHTG